MENKLGESIHHFVKALGEVDLVRLVFVQSTVDLRSMGACNRNSPNSKPTSKRCMQPAQRRRVNFSQPTKLVKLFWNVPVIYETRGAFTRASLETTH
jgi:hypothetical protein